MHRHVGDLGLVLLARVDILQNASPLDDVAIVVQHRTAAIAHPQPAPVRDAQAELDVEIIECAALLLADGSRHTLLIVGVNLLDPRHAEGILVGHAGQLFPAFHGQQIAIGRPAPEDQGAGIGDRVQPAFVLAPRGLRRLETEPKHLEFADPGRRDRRGQAVVAAVAAGDGQAAQGQSPYRPPDQLADMDGHDDGQCRRQRRTEQKAGQRRLPAGIEDLKRLGDHRGPSGRHLDPLIGHDGIQTLGGPGLEEAAIEGDGLQPVPVGRFHADGLLGIARARKNASVAVRDGDQNAGDPLAAGLQGADQLQGRQGQNEDARRRTGLDDGQGQVNAVILGSGAEHEIGDERSVALEGLVSDGQHLFAGRRLRTVGNELDDLDHTFQADALMTAALQTDLIARRAGRPQRRESAEHGEAALDLGFDGIADGQCRFAQTGGRGVPIGCARTPGCISGDHENGQKTDQHQNDEMRVDASVPRRDLLVQRQCIRPPQDRSFQM